MKKITLLLMMLLFAMFSFGQVSNYTFSQSMGTYTAITSGTLHGTAIDNANYSFTIPFTFTYNGVGYTVARPTTNGFLVLGSNAPSTSQYTPLSSGSTNFAIAAFARDLNATVRSEVIGTSPNRIYVCQWSSAYRYAVGSGENLNAQVRLYEGTNKVEIVYGDFITTNTTSATGTVQVGLRGSATTDWNNRSTSTDWDGTIAGTANSAACSGTTTVKPAIGKTLTWTPPVIAIDMASTDVVGIPTSGCANGSVPLSVTIKNNGANAIDFSTNNAAVSLNITGASTQVLTTAVNSGTLPSGASQTVLISPNADFSVAGTHNIAATVTVSGDGLAGNNTLTTSKIIALAAVVAPYSEGFTSAVTPTGWNTTGWTIGATHANGTNGIYKSISSAGTSLPFNTISVGPISATSQLRFDYRIVNSTSYPATATPAGWGSYKVQVSTDCGVTFVDLETVNDANHATGLSWFTRVNSLAAYSGQNVQIRILPIWVTGSYFLDFDNFSIAPAPTLPPDCTTGHSPADLAADFSRNGTLTWIAATGFPASYDVYFGTSTNPTLVTNTTGLSYTPPTMAGATTYYWKVVPKNENGDASGCTERSFTTAANFVYCAPSYSSGSGTTDGITNVTLGALNNSSGHSASPYYTFFNTVTIPDITQATTTGVSIAFGVDTSQYSAVWIDFNQNGVFEASEGFLGANNTSAGVTPTLVNISIPVGAVLGNTRMRVRGGNDSSLLATQACGATTSSYGETEDYIVNVIQASVCTGTPTAGTVSPISTISCTGALPGVRTVTGSTSGVSGLTYQWQESTDNFATTVADAVGGSGATTLSYTPPAYTANIQYRLRVTCTATSEIDYSTISQVNGASAPTTQASNVLVSNALTSSAISWTNGNGARRFVVVNTVNSFTDPSGTADVTGVSTVYTSGEKIVYDGTGSTVTVTGLASNTQYFVRVFEYARCTGTPNINYYNVTTGTNNPSSFTSAINNDVCANAITIACSESITTSLVGSTNENQAVCGISGVTTQNSAGTWYKFTGNGDDVTISTGSSATNVDTRLAVFSGTCAGLTCIGGNDDIVSGNVRSEVLFSTSVGTDYYILLYSYSSTTPTAAIVLTATCTPACVPATNNDVCANASSVVINTPLSTNNSCSSPSGVSYPTCGSSFGTFYDTWYSFNSGAVTSVQVSATPTTTALVGYAVYSGVCGTLSQVACNTTGVLSTVALTANTNYYVRVFSISPSGRGDFTLNIIAPNTWTGLTSTSWSDETNWSLGTVPNGTRDVIIPTTANNPILATDFTVQTGKTLTISGTGALTLSPAASLTIQGTASFGGKSVTLQSDATGTAMLGEVTGTLTGATNVTVERYIPAKRVWRALTAPLKGVSGSLYTTWQNGGTVTANTGVEIWGPAGTSMAVGPNYSVLNYTPTGWTSVTNTTTANLFDATTNNAYLVFVTGGYGSGNIASTLPATATTLKATGSLITGDVAYTGLIDTKHTLIGNPYASSLSPSAILTGATNLINKFWVYDPALGSSGGYVSYDAGLGTYSNSTGSYATSTTAVQSGQAFFVRATTSTVGSFTISENKKSTDVSNVFGKNANQAANNAVTASIFRVGFYKETSLGWNPLDGAIAGFYPTANNLVDENDGKKFANGSENIAFVRNNTTLSSEHFLEPQPLDELYMRVWNTSVNNYKLRINTELFTVPNIEAKLIDLFTGVQTPLVLDGTIQEYPFAVTSATASTGDRFKVVFSASPLATTAFDTKAIKVYPNPVTNGIVNVQLPEGDYTNYSYELVNVLGQKVLSNTIEVLSGSQFSFNTRGLANTWYVLQLLNNGKPVYQTKVIIAN
ncbi:GEVED domain-containing protein [uncultured Flavobacterium sp.]|uniref:GEVED domain-containing protein n=1 Tax=uncultured Flavobacterium sp. TaxID=165435 RepID=UPI0030ECC1C3|tara:strand:+ start:17106 stop:22574 length:5469 start_codon:yes stop_codon:yes gene_type:complete